MHASLAGIILCSLCSGGLVDHALLHDCAVHGEAVGGWLGGVGGGCCGDEGFQDGALEVFRLVSVGVREGRGGEGRDIR